MSVWAASVESRNFPEELAPQAPPWLRIWTVAWSTQCLACAGKDGTVRIYDMTQDLFVTGLMNYTLRQDQPIRDKARLHDSLSMQQDFRLVQDSVLSVSLQA